MTRPTVWDVMSHRKTSPGTSGARSRRVEAVVAVRNELACRRNEVLHSARDANELIHQKGAGT